MKLIDAFNLAETLHRGQVDKAGEPYILHCVRVMLRLPPDASETERMAALLHDAIEDVPGAISAMGEAGVPDEVMAMCIALTRIEGEAYPEFLDRVAASTAKRVKLADIYDNSDATRLAKLPSDTAARLRKKYENAATRIR